MECQVKDYEDVDKNDVNCRTKIKIGTDSEKMLKKSPPTGLLALVEDENLEKASSSSSTVKPNLQLTRASIAYLHLENYQYKKVKQVMVWSLFRQAFMMAQTLNSMAPSLSRAMEALLLWQGAPSCRILLQPCILIQGKSFSFRTMAYFSLFMVEPAGKK